MQPVPPVAPGLSPAAYPGPGQAAHLRANEFQYLFQQQLLPAGTSSIAMQLERIKSAYFYPIGVSFQIWFTDVNGAATTPGTFQIDIQDSDIDLDAQYCVISSLTGGLNAAFVGRVELPNFWAKFVRVNIKTLTNAVYINVLVTR